MTLKLSTTFFTEKTHVFKDLIGNMVLETCVKGYHKKKLLRQGYP